MNTRLVFAQTVTFVFCTLNCTQYLLWTLKFQPCNSFHLTGLIIYSLLYKFFKSNCCTQIFHNYQKINIDILQEDICKTLLGRDSTFKILPPKNSQVNQQADTINTVTSKKRLKFGNSVTAEWMANDQFDTCATTEGNE